MSRTKSERIPEPPEALFGRIVSILEQARGNVVRAEYGKKVIEALSVRLNEKYGKGFLHSFRGLTTAY